MVKIKVKNSITKKNIKLNSENNLSKMSVADFFENGLVKEEVDDGIQSTKASKKFKKIGKDKQVKKSKVTSMVSKLIEREDNVTDDVKLHKKQLNKLKQIDPQFYQFLERNDKNLLQFNLGDAEHLDDVNETSEDENVDSVHKTVDDLEVQSDEEDFEDDGEYEDGAINQTSKVTLKTLKQWEVDLQNDVIKLDTIKFVTQAFGSALASITMDNAEGTSFRVEGAAIFNGVIQLCVLHLQPALNRFLGISPDAKRLPEKTKKWKKLRNCLKRYVNDVTKLIENVSSGNITSVLLKHIHAMSIYLSLFVTSVVKPLLKRLVILWSTSSEETVRILSFLCILRIVRAQQPAYLSIVLKAMYMAYVRNSKFVSPTTLPGINFMRRSLIEIFALDLNVSYQHSFLYIRQLAIHLRNAVTLNKKDAYQSVYNWQYLNSIRLWADLLSFTYNKQQLQSLIYPLVSIITGCIKLIPTSQFFPLRFHCIKVLIKISKETNIFIPVLPYILEVFESNIFNKKPTEIHMKPINFACIFRVNKKEICTNVFRDEIIENIYGLLLEYLSSISNNISFPDVALLASNSLRKYLKVCKNSNYSRKLKQLLDKIDENSKFIEQQRNNITFSLNDQQLINSWETNIRNSGTPISVYYESWAKTNLMKQKRVATDSEDINDYNLPTINRDLYNKRSNVKSDGPVELFPSDDEENELEIGEISSKPVGKKKSAKKIKSKKIVQKCSDEAMVDDDNDNNEVDIVKDFDMKDWD